MCSLIPRTLTILTLAAAAFTATADVKVPAIFSDHMVLQRDLENPVWGQADPGEEVTVTIGSQSKSTTADDDGSWKVKLDPMDAGGPYALNIKGNNTLTITDVLVGEVWVCAGQSNMEWPLIRSDAPALEIASANYPEIRLLSIKKNPKQEPQFTFKGKWEVCSPETVKNFSAIGFLFGKRLYNTLHVPVGLIDNAWGGSSVEAWLPREAFDVDDFHQQYLKNKEQHISAYTDETRQQDLAKWEAAVAKWKADGSKGRKPRKPSDPRYNQHRPGNIYYGEVAPIIGYGIKGMIWYQGESNAGRAYHYRTSFPLMIETFREQWDQGDFPFYWVQLADYQSEKDQPGDSNWAELREAQTLTLDLPNTGQAVIIDVGEGRDIHPRNKQVPANRLAMLALSNDYGYDIPAESPMLEDVDFENGKAILTFKNIDQGLRSFDTNEVTGFAIAGEDQNFVRAQAKITGKNTIEVWSDEISDPVSVRYGWATNPVANVQDRNSLPLTPFRTDDWKLTTE